MNNDIFAFMDEYGDHVVIVGTNDRVAAEQALRRTEEEWFGPVEGRTLDDAMEKPMNMDDFYAADVHCGTYKGEDDVYYWGAEPEQFFDGGKFTTEDGFIAHV